MADWAGTFSTFSFEVLIIQVSVNNVALETAKSLKVNKEMQRNV
jgi:hypothetical protein